MADRVSPRVQPARRELDLAHGTRTHGRGTRRGGAAHLGPGPQKRPLQRGDLPLDHAGTVRSGTAIRGHQAIPHPGGIPQQRVGSAAGRRHRTLLPGDHRQQQNLSTLGRNVAGGRRHAGHALCGQRAFPGVYLRPPAGAVLARPGKVGLRQDAPGARVRKRVGRTGIPGAGHLPRSGAALRAGALDSPRHPRLLSRAAFPQRSAPRRPGAEDAALPTARAARRRHRGPQRADLVP